ncbi:hypothetical protein MFLAVUS_010488 [Mucor flavus]|uniref:Uncharacterized protein n=1 Tax=Mucor flavus TaxID=439312 RepID=A0ABP9ZCW8_9FUNG
MTHLRHTQFFKDGTTINIRNVDGFDIAQLISSDFQREAFTPTKECSTLNWIDIEQQELLNEYASV